MGWGTMIDPKTGKRRNTWLEGHKRLNERMKKERERQKQMYMAQNIIPVMHNGKVVPMMAQKPLPKPILKNDMVQQLGIKAAPSTKDVKAKQQEKKLAQQQKKEKEEFQTLILNQGKPLTKDQKDFNEVIGAK